MASCFAYECPVNYEPSTTLTLRGGSAGAPKGCPRTGPLERVGVVLG